MRAPIAALLILLSVSGCALLGIGDDHPPIDTPKKRLVVAYGELRAVIVQIRQLCAGDVLSESVCDRATKRLTQADSALDKASEALSRDEKIKSYLDKAKTKIGKVTEEIPEL